MLFFVFDWVIWSCSLMTKFLQRGVMFLRPQKVSKSVSTRTGSRPSRAWKKLKVSLENAIPLTNDEINEAELYIIRSVQIEVYHAEIQALSQKKPVHKDSRIRTYSEFLDSSRIIRMRSRLQNAEYLTYDQLCPIILPRNHIVKQLIARYFHEERKQY